MGTRSTIATGLLAVAVGGILLARAFTQPVVYVAEFSQSEAYLLLFGPAAWILPLAVFLGILTRALVTPPDGSATKAAGRIVRHDEHMFFSHWSNALSVTILAATGVLLGFLFLPRLLHAPEAVAFVLNVHFVGCVLFLFGLAYIVSDFVLGGGLTGLWPAPTDLKDTFSYYGAKLGIGQPPKQGKYLASEKLSFPIWVLLVAGITITGGVKAAAHVWSLPAGLMAAMTFMHGACALGMLGLITMHVILGAIVPWSWPLLRSMVTGYMDEHYVREHHPLWYEEMEERTNG